MEDNKLPGNPPAFPCTDGETFANDGMSLRDYFACQAINSLASQFIDKFEIHRVDVLASEAYRVADAMLNERLKK